MGSSRLEVTPRVLLSGVQSGAERPTLMALKEKALIGQYLLDLFLAYEGISTNALEYSKGIPSI
jgi:hypothetical protein